MARPKTVHVCQECGYTATKWMGRCPGCEAWNTLVEEVREPEPTVAQKQANTKKGYGAAQGGEPVRLSDVVFESEDRVHSNIHELDRVLGGGFVPGGVVIIGGEPGIGKSTLSLQVAGHFGSGGRRVLYISGEESLGQLKMRAERLGALADNMWVVSETSLERVDALVQKEKPDLLVVDSIQTLATERLTSSPGSVAQLREVTGALTQLAKGFEIPTILIGHVTKEGSIAGPKILEHMVDTVLYFESQSGSNYRLLRAVKNRFGSTNEVGVFEMRGDGLREVPNPSAVFLEGRPVGASGSVVVPVMEGTRPLLCEIQALVSPPNYGPPRVTTVGVDSNRALLLLNILEKRTGLKVAGMDVFVNVTGGVRVAEPAADLGIALAILSSFFDRAIPADTLVFGELGLTGELRAAPQAVGRLLEARKLGFENAIIARANASASTEREDLASFGLRTCDVVTDAIRHAFGDDVLRG